MRVLKESDLIDKKEYCCGGDVTSSQKFKHRLFICGDYFGKGKIVLCNKCYKRLMDGNN